MGTGKEGTANASLGAIGELMFAAEARSRGHVVFFPIGEALAGMDVVMISKTGRAYTVQVKAQSTQRLRAVDLRVGPSTARGRRLGATVDCDIVAVFWNEWHLVPRRTFASGRKTLRVNDIKQHQGWGCVR